MNDRHQLFVGLFLLMLSIGLGVWQWNELQGINETVAAQQIEVSNLRTFSSKLAEDYKTINVEVSASRQETKQGLNQVLPENEDLTALTRLFDDYAVTNDFASNPFFISSIQYNKPSPDDESPSYRSTTLDISIDASKRNLSKFLEMIEASGSVEAGTRLMSVSKLKISYPTEYGGTYSVNAEIRAYYAPSL